MKHDLYETGDADAPDTVKDRNGDVVLDLCRTCNKGEAELGDTCTPEPVQYMTAALGYLERDHGILGPSLTGPEKHALAEARRHETMPAEAARALAEARKGPPAAPTHPALAAMQGFLRVCSSGGMPRKDRETVEASVQEAARLGYFDTEDHPRAYLVRESLVASFGWGAEDLTPAWVNAAILHGFERKFSVSRTARMVNQMGDAVEHAQTYLTNEPEA